MLGALLYLRPHRCEVWCLAPPAPEAAQVSSAPSSERRISSSFFPTIFRRRSPPSAVASRQLASRRTPDFSLATTLGIFGSFLILVIVLFLGRAGSKTGPCCTEAEVRFPRSDFTPETHPLPSPRRPMATSVRPDFHPDLQRLEIPRRQPTLAHVIGWWIILTTLNLHFTGRRPHRRQTRRQCMSAARAAG